MIKEHTNKWWRGRGITIIKDGGKGVVDVLFDDKYPITVFIKNLSVLEDFRKKGIGTQLLQLAENAGRLHGMKFAELTADKKNKWLVDWYLRNGYHISYVDENEYSMTKVLY